MKPASLGTILVLFVYQGVTGRLSEGLRWRRRAAELRLSRRQRNRASPQRCLHNCRSHSPNACSPWALRAAARPIRLEDGYTLTDEQLGQKIVNKVRKLAGGANYEPPLEGFLKHCARNRPPRTETAGSSLLEWAEKPRIPETTQRRRHHFFRLWLRLSRVRIPSSTPHIELPGIHRRPREAASRGFTLQ